MTSNLLVLGVVNAAVIGYLVYSHGGQYRLALLAIVAVAIGSGIGLVIGNWLEENGYTMGD